MDTDRAFEGLVGYASLKKSLGNILDALTRLELYHALGGTPPKGLCFIGSPGTGKTSFALAFMKAMGRKEFLVRPGDPRLEDLDALFATAKEEGPSVLLFDDLDAAYGMEGRETRYGHLQALIDEYAPEDVFVMATLNSSSRIPASLLRAGRFDYAFAMNGTSPSDAAALVASFASKVKAAKDVNVYDLEGLVTSLSPAAAKAAVEQAARLALGEGESEVKMHHFVEAIEEKRLEDEDISLSSFGGAKPSTKEIGYHEAGHLLAAEALAPGIAGFAATWQKDGNVRLLRDDALSSAGEVLLSLAGKCAVETFLPKTATGAYDDLRKAYDRVAEGYFENGEMGLMNLDFSYKEGMMAKPARFPLGSFLEMAYSYVRKLLLDNEEYVEEAARLLSEKHYLLRSDIKALGEKFPIHREAVMSFVLDPKAYLRGKAL